MARPPNLRMFAFPAAQDAPFEPCFSRVIQVWFCTASEGTGAILNLASRLSLTALVLLGPVACASHPDVELTSHGRLPVAEPATFAGGTAEGGGRLLQDASLAVEQALSARGWRTEAANPQWQIETSYAERPRSLGAFVEEAAPQEPEGWRIGPTPRRWWRRDGREGVLAVRIVDATTGMEVVQAEAKGSIGSGPTGAILHVLAEAAVAEALAVGRQPSDALR